MYRVKVLLLGLEIVIWPTIESDHRLTSESLKDLVRLGTTWYQL